MAEDVYGRINYLYQVIEDLSKHNIEANITLIHHYSRSLSVLTQKKVLRIAPGIRRRICKQCRSYLVPGVTATIRMRSNRQKHKTVTCTLCGELKRFNTSSDPFQNCSLDGIQRSMTEQEENPPGGSKRNLPVTQKSQVQHWHHNRQQKEPISYSSPNRDAQSHWRSFPNQPYQQPSQYNYPSLNHLDSPPSNHLSCPPPAFNPNNFPPSNYHYFPTPNRPSGPPPPFYQTYNNSRPYSPASGYATYQQPYRPQHQKHHSPSHTFQNFQP